jgi:hypothetical protein
MEPKRKFNPAFLIGLIVIIITAFAVFAAERITLDGFIKGASCVHYKQECPEDEAHLAMEHDFVLAQPDGKHYFLPNLSRTTKARFANRSVRVSGDLEGHSIWADELQVKTDGKFSTVWSWKKQQELYKGGGG